MNRIVLLILLGLHWQIIFAQQIVRYDLYVKDTLVS